MVVMLEAPNAKVEDPDHHLFDSLELSQLIDLQVQTKQ